MPDWLVAVFAVWALWGIWVWIAAFKKRRSAELGAPAADCAFVERYGVADYLFAAFLGLFFLLMILGSAPADAKAELTRQGIINGIVLYGSMAVAVLSFLLMRGMPPGMMFGLGRHPAGPPATESPPLSRDARLSLFLFAAAYPVIALVQWASLTLMGETADAQEIVKFLAGSASWGDRALVIALAVVVAPAVEELIFRGYLYGVLRKAGGIWCGAATTALLFAAVHGHLPSLAALFLLGLVLSLIYEWTRRLWLVMALHALFNAISVAGILLWPEGVK